MRVSILTVLLYFFLSSVTWACGDAGTGNGLPHQIGEMTWFEVNPRSRCSLTGGDIPTGDHLGGPYNGAEEFAQVQEILSTKERVRSIETSWLVYVTVNTATAADAAGVLAYLGRWHDVTYVTSEGDVLLIIYSDWDSSCNPAQAVLHEGSISIPDVEGCEIRFSAR